MREDREKVGEENPHSINGKNEKSKSLSVPKKDDLKLKTIDIDPG